MSSSALSKQYDPSEVEPRWLRFWQTNGYFHADETTPTVPYSITLPPPNVTGSLHMGHALGSTLQDILIRWRRMQGSNAMWMPGTDHASIAVHTLLEKDISVREGKSRFDLGRDEFLRRAWIWKERSGSRITEQEKLMGFSLDWARERFTMDEGSNRAVREAFVRLYEQKLIYRGKKMINWDTISETVVSDLEVDTVEEDGSLWELRYPIEGSEEVLIVATTRPETMLGDTGVAVHPDDPRYQHLIGKRVRLPLTDRTIPIVGDTFVDREFGSGAVKVTPAHDPTDYECSKRCGLDILQVIDLKGRMQDPAPAAYVGLTADQARKQVVADLEALGLLGAVKPHKVPRGRSARSGAVIEPMLMVQWFVAAAALAQPAIEAVEKGKTKIVPEVQTKTYMHWMTNIKDWCISRQLWWGHRIPAWYCDPCGEVVVARQDPTACPACGGALRQDEDILDTWFSSALWPFSTLGWPDKTRELATFYPNNVLVTGPDIIFFWVARMMMMGLHFMGKVPFRTVYLTSIVTDEDGTKMSKTLGNVIDPLDVVHGATLEQILERGNDIPDPRKREAAQKTTRKLFAKGIPAMGADALRFTLAALNTSGRYIRLSVDRVEGYRNFINKLWNASRFALMNLDGYDPDRFEQQLATSKSGSGAEVFGLPERWILSRLQRVCGEVDQALEGFRFAEAANAIYQFVWHELCDWYIEMAKPSLYVNNGEPDPSREPRRHAAQGVLATCLETTLRLLHPFAPYVTEEIWQKLPKPQALPASLMVTVYPRVEDARLDADAEQKMAMLQEITVGVRMLRGTYNVPPSWSVPVEIHAPEATRAILERHRDIVENGAKVTLTLGGAGSSTATQSAKAVIGADVEIVMPLAGLIDVAAEKTRIGKEIAKAEKEIAYYDRKLADEKFMARAPADVVLEQRTRKAEEEARKARLVEALAQLG